MHLKDIDINEDQKLGDFKVNVNYLMVGGGGENGRKEGVRLKPIQVEVVNILNILELSFIISSLLDICRKQMKIKN